MKKAAIVGCGGIAAVHAGVLDHFEGADLIACADIKPERAKAMAEKGGLQACENLTELRGQ